jgi:hypothetical protein
MLSRSSPPSDALRSHTWQRVAIHRAHLKERVASLGFHSEYLQIDLILSDSIFVPRMDDPMINYNETTLPNTSPLPDSHGKNCAPKVPASMNRTSIWCQDSGRTSK